MQAAGDFIEVYPNAYEPDYCNAAIKWFEMASSAGLGMSRQQQGSMATPRHTKDDTAIDLVESKSLKLGCSDLTKYFLNKFFKDPNFYGMYSDKYSILQTVNGQAISHLKIQKTNPGGGYHVWHYENASFFNKDRLAVFTLYLNAINDGGETEFLYQRKRIKPEQGSLVIWPAGFTHTHRGNPPLSEDKYILTGWIETLSAA